MNKTINIDPDILRLISKYIAKDISEIEFYTLKQWLAEDALNRRFFINYLKNYKKSRRNELVKILDKDVAWNVIVSKLEHPIDQIPVSKVDKNRELLPIILKYAAIAILFLGVGYLYRYTSFTKTKKEFNPTNKVTLQSDNGSIKFINENDSSNLTDTDGNIVGKQNGNQLVYSGKSKKETVTYNTLRIPYGKRFEIELSDGTLVHLNAGSSLKYPVKFSEENKNRVVFLKGEAFFSVAKDAQHPFIVNSENLNVQVLGTKFNITAYKEDSTTDVVLVEGSVGMYEDIKTLKDATRLNPGTMGSFNNNNYTISTDKVNTKIYTSWVQGNLFFRNMSFKNIAKKMERHYNMEIIIENEQLNDEVFNANFNDEPIEKVLSYFSDSFNINYRIDGNTVYIS